MDRRTREGYARTHKGNTPTLTKDKVRARTDAHSTVSYCITHRIILHILLYCTVSRIVLFRVQSQLSAGRPRTSGPLLATLSLTLQNLHAKPPCQNTAYRSGAIHGPSCVARFFLHPPLYALMSRVACCSILISTAAGRWQRSQGDARRAQRQT